MVMKWNFFKVMMTLKQKPPSPEVLWAISAQDMVHAADSVRPSYQNIPEQVFLVNLSREVTTKNSN